MNPSISSKSSKRLLFVSNNKKSQWNQYQSRLCMRWWGMFLLKNNIVHLHLIKQALFSWSTALDLRVPDLGSKQNNGALKSRNVSANKCKTEHSKKRKYQTADQWQYCGCRIIFGFVSKDSSLYTHLVHVDRLY
jgi:hypothetical protein